MNGTPRWLVTIGAALLALAACVSVVWLVGPWDLGTRVAIGTSGGVVVGAVIALWGAAAVDRAADHVPAVGRGAEPSGGPGDPPGDPGSWPQAQELRRVGGSLVIQSGGDVHFGSSSILVSPQPALTRPGVVTAVVTAFHEAPPSGGWPMTSPTRHEGSLTAGRLEIRPVHPYLDLVHSGAELTLMASGGDSWEHARPAQLDIKVVNNTHETVVVHQVRLNVACSIPHVHCVPFVREGKAELRPQPFVRGPIAFGPARPSLRVRGQYSNITLRFHLEHPTRAGALTSEYSWEGYPWPPWEWSPLRRANDDYSLIRALAEAGAYPVEDEQSAWRIYETPYRDSRFRGPFHSRIWEVGPFDGNQAIMAGTVSYAELGSDDMERSYSYRFRAPIDLTIDYPSHIMGFSAPIEFSAPTAVSASYVAPVLKTDDTDYFVEVPVSHSLAPGEADRLLVALTAKHASTHDLRVSLLCSIGSVNCGAVHLETFRTFGDLVPLAESA